MDQRFDFHLRAFCDSVLEDLARGLISRSSAAHKFYHRMVPLHVALRLLTP